MTTTNELLAAVARGEISPEDAATRAHPYFKHSHDAARTPEEFEAWQAVMRVLSTRDAQTQHAPPLATVRASCGHDVAPGQMMTASLGTSCTNCYDRLSGEE